MLEDMRHDIGHASSSLNGAQFVSADPASATIHRSNSPCSSSNGYVHTTPSSMSHMNGSMPNGRKVVPPSFFGHDREEVARLLIQALQDLGYYDSSSLLTQESGFELETPAVVAFRNAILSGDWYEAEALLFGSPEMSNGGHDGASLINGHSALREALPLAEGIDRDELRFRLRRQKYLELLEERDHAGALLVLRQELTPLHKDVSQLHVLSSLMVSPSADDLKVQANWDGAQGLSRRLLLSELSKAISPSVMIPEHRLAAILDQVKQSQISKCHYHNPTTALSLFSDHSCDRSQFPLQNIHQIAQSAEIWFLKFSNNGTRLVTSGQDSTVFIYDTNTFQEIHKLTEHKDHVAYAAWSPDDTRLITCSHDKTARIWDTASGQCLSTIHNHNEPLTTAAWSPDGECFVTGSLDKKSPLTLWSHSSQKLHAWPANYRVQDLAISPDGERLVTISAEKQIHVYKLKTREEEYSLRLKTDLTCINISRDSKYMLVNMADNELQLIDINSAEIVQRFLGQKQGNYVIRSSFGGADENLVISGSEDGKIYIFHKERGTIIETLDGHAGGCVNAVAWNPADSCMFASAGDDNKIRIWSKSGGTRSGRGTPADSDGFNA